MIGNKISCFCSTVLVTVATPAWHVSTDFLHPSAGYSEAIKVLGGERDKRWRRYRQRQVCNETVPIQVSLCLILLLVYLSVVLDSHIKQQKMDTPIVVSLLCFPAVWYTENPGFESMNVLSQM